MKTALDRLFQHLHWADDQLLRAAEAAGDYPPPALRLLGHILGAERVWLLRIQGLDPGAAPVWPQLSIQECRALSDQNRRGHQERLAATPPEGFEEVIAYRDTKGVQHRTRLGDILLHVALHGAHHRGQIAAILRGAGMEPGGTDYIRFCRAGLLGGQPE
ncbi:MAG: DinB family protein [Holophaga sp.]|jgi:uncharacterized damage-inducible protein DinB